MIKKDFLVWLPDCLPNSLPTCPPILPISWSVCPFIHLSVLAFISMSYHSSTRPFIHLYLKSFIYLSSHSSLYSIIHLYVLSFISISFQSYLCHIIHLPVFSFISLSFHSSLYILSFISILFHSSLYSFIHIYILSFISMSFHSSCPFIHLSIFICPSVSQFFHPYVCQSICLSLRVCPFICSSNYRPVRVYLSIWTSVHMFSFNYLTLMSHHRLFIVLQHEIWDEFSRFELLNRHTVQLGKQQNGQT